MTDDLNPFDAYADPEDVPASEGLQPAPEPSLWQSFQAGAGNVLSGGGLLGGARALADSKTMNRTDLAQPGDSPFAGKPTQGEVDAARHRYEQRQRDEESYASFHSDTVAGKAAGLLGSVAAGALLPENFVSAGGLVSGGVATGLRAAGSAGGLARVFGGAAEAGAVNVGLDAAAQGLNVASGLQERYDPKQGVIAFGVGAGLGGGMHAIAEGVAAVRERRVALDAQAQTQAATSPYGTLDSNALGGKDAAPAPAASPFGTLDPNAFPEKPPAPVVAPDPQAAQAAVATAQAVATLPDKTLDKVAGAVALTDPQTAAADGMVRVPLSVEESAALKQAGVDVDVNGVMPAEQAAGLVAARNERDRASATAEPETPAAPTAVVETPQDGSGAASDQASATTIANKGENAVPASPGEAAQPMPAADGGGAGDHLLRGDLVLGMQPHRVATPDGRGVEVAPIVVEARDLRTSADAGYDASLQPRDRGRAASQAQIRDIATNLDPDRLGFSAEADRGAPIIGADGSVESGNGRVLALRSVYDQGGEAAARYREWLAGHGVDVARYDQPVLVRQRLTDLSPEDRQAFTVGANQAATLSMSASERALADSHILTPSRLDLLRNADDLGAAANAEFRRAFVGALPASERGALTAADGAVSAEGLTRIRNAVLAAAYGDSPVLARIAEATHDEVRSISNALTAAAPEWARLKADIAEGRVPTDFDLRADLLEAVQRTADLRAKGTKLADAMAQQDAFSQLSTRVEQFMRLFYDPNGRRAAGAQRITDALRFYAEEARKVSAERGLDLGLTPVRPEDIQGAARERTSGQGEAGQQATLFERGRPRDSAGGAAGRGEVSGRGSGERSGGDGDASEGRGAADRAADLRSVDEQLADWKRAQPHETVDALYKVAGQHQQQLGEVGRDLADAADAKFLDPGLKAQAGAAEKIARKGYDRAGRHGARELTDIVRGGFEVSTPDQAEAIIAGLRRHFEVLDEGWAVTASGYSDRKVLVRFGDGTLGEVQVLPKEMLAAKKGGGHRLYDQSRSLPAGDPERIRLEQEQRDLYAAALARSGEDWKAAFGSSGSDGNRASNTAGDTTRAELNTSSASTRSQDEGLPSDRGSISAQASPDLRKQGRPSQIQRSIGDTSTTNIGRGEAGRNLDGIDDERAQPLRAQAAARGAAPPAFDPDRRFPNRRELAGESAKLRTLPADATPEEVHAFRVTDAMRGIAARMDRKLEVDRRLNTRGTLGEYKLKEGVLRIRQEGDVEVFSHELGHAADQRLATTAGPEWTQARRQFADELRALDANTTDPAKKTVNEGVAEYLRSYITNPAYARNQAPGFAAAFDRLLAARDPELQGILADAARMSQIDSGMAPVDVFRTMISPGSQTRGLARFREEARRTGLVPTLGLWYDRFYAAVISPDHWAKRFQDQLRDARFQKTGQPMPEFGWADPYKMLRGLPGARQAALDSVYYGVRGYGSSFRDAPRSPAIYDALSKAFDGHVTLIEKPDHPLVKAFSGYLIARRAAALYERFKAGEIRNPPVRASEAETHGAIADFETANPRFRDAAADIFAFNQAMWIKKFEAGLIGRDLYETVAGRGDDYVPFFRDMSDNSVGGGGGSGGAGQERSIVKRLQGSSRQIIDPLHSLIYDAVQTERVIALNDVFKAMHDLARTGGEFSGRFLEQVPNTELRAQSVDIAEGLRAAANRAGLDKADAETMIRHIEDMVGDDLTASVFRATQATPKGERIAFYWRDGERTALKFGNDEVSKAFFDTVSGMTSSERDLLLAMFGKINGLFSQFITQAPQFALKNLLVDNMSRVFIARNTGLLGRVPGSAIVEGLRTQIFDQEFAKAYAALGGHRGGVVAAASRELAGKQGLGAVTLKPKTLADMKAEIVSLLGHPKDLAIDVFKSPLHALEGLMKVIEGTETTGRLGQAKIVHRYLKKQGLSDEEAFHGALYEARDVLDYDRRGTGVNAATKFFVFLNPALQATERSARNLFGEPFRAAMEAYRRGGYANLDEAGKTALADAVKNYGMIALGTVATMGYYAWNADNPVYQRMSAYMKRRYYIFDAGQGTDGRQMVVTMPKPFDHAGGIFGAVEAAMDGIRRADPEGWSHVVSALMDGFVPRQVSSLQDFISGNPALKTAFEVETGTRLGFDGSAPQPIVPQGLASMPPEKQYTGATSIIAKKMGQWFGVSPLVADHVMSGIGGTAVKDTSNLITSVFDDQPNVTVKDAMTRMFFGALYREQKGGGGFRSDVMDLMGRSNGAYATAVADYKDALRLGDASQADAIYARANDTAKALMTLRGYAAFKPEIRQLHPLERTASIGTILSSVMRDLASSHLEVQDRSLRAGQAHRFIDVSPTTARAISNTVGSWMAEEMRNGLTIAKEPGYANYDVIDTAARLDAIYTADPAVGEEIRKRFDTAHVLPLDTVAHQWPGVEQRLLQDREKADLVSFLPGGQLAARRAAHSR